MKRQHTFAHMVIGLALTCALVAVGPQAQKPTVQIPQPGVPQIMTLEGAFVRVAYNNEKR